MKKIAPLFCFTALCVLCLLLCGCPQSRTDSAKEAKQLPFEGVKLKLLVVDDPAMAKAIERLRGEWSTQSGSDFEIVQSSGKELAESESLSADAVLCSSAQFALLAEKNLLAEVPEKIRTGAAGADVFELPKIREASWAGKIYSIPFGSPVLTIYYRADLLKKLNRTPPKNWTEYQEIAALLEAEKNSTPESPWHGTLEPFAPSWAGVMLLARAAPYMKHRDNYSTWFDCDTMEPLIDNPAMVRILTKLVETLKPSAAEALKSDPATIRRAFWAGQCGMALTWPTASEQKTADSAAKNDASAAEATEKSAGKKAEFEVGFCELPGSTKAYNVSEKRWEDRHEEESPFVPFLGIAGRMGAVSAKSPAREAAFALIVWLSDGQNSQQICPVSTATTLFRKSQLTKPQLWTEKELAPTAATQYAETTATTLSRETWLDLRLPGREEYLAALDEAVQAAVEGKSPPADALAQAAEKWRKITEKLGKERQKTAFLHSLGLP